MKTILGQKVTKYQFYKNGRLKNNTRGFIWLKNGTSIRIEGSKFFIYLTDRKKVGFVNSSMKAYKQIKRMIARWFQLYRKHGAFNNGVEYWQDSISQSLKNLNLKQRSYVHA